MGVLNRTTDEINTLLDKIANLPEEGMGGKDGKTPVFETGTTTTLEAGLQATSEVVRNGEDVSGNPKYKINFGIPRGQDGTSGGGGGVADSVDWDNVQNKPTWVDSATKPTYTASEVGAIATGSLKTINGQSLEGKGNIEISGSGSGIADAPFGGKIYARINGTWVDAIELNGQTISCVPYDSMINEVTDQPFDISELGETGDASAFIYHDFYFVGNRRLYLGTVTSMIASEVDGKNLFTFIINFEQEDGTPSIVYLIVNLTDETYSTKIHRVSGGIPDAPADGQVYGRKNNKWSVIQQSGGTNSFVDITELFLRINSLNNGEKANQEDYDTLLEYARNRTNVSAYNSMPTTGMFISSLAIFTTSDRLIIHFISYLYGVATPQANLISISSTLEIQKMSYLYQDAIELDGYKPATKYTPIGISDSISEAFGKLEAGVKQSISGENNVYILPIELYHLRNESTSEQISTAIGGDEGFNNIVAAIKSFKRFYFKMNEEMICEVAMTYFSAGENNKAIVMRVSSYGAFNQYAGIISVGTITKENSTYTFEALALQSQA